MTGAAIIEVQSCDIKAQDSLMSHSERGAHPSSFTCILLLASATLSSSAPHSNLSHPFPAPLPGPAYLPLLTMAYHYQNNRGATQPLDLTHYGSLVKLSNSEMPGRKGGKYLVPIFFLFVIWPRTQRWNLKHYVLGLCDVLPFFWMHSIHFDYIVLTLAHTVHHVSKKSLRWCIIRTVVYSSFLSVTLLHSRTFFNYMVKHNCMLDVCDTMPFSDRQRHWNYRIRRQADKSG